MAEEIEYKGTITFEIYESAQYLFNGYRWLILLIIPVLTVIYALLLDNSLTDRIILFVLAGLSIPALYYYQKWKWHYHYNHSPYLNEPLKGIVTTDSIITEISSGRSETPWSNFIKYKSTENIMLLYLGPNVFKTIARDFFTSTEDWEKAKLIAINGMKKNS